MKKKLWLNYKAKNNHLFSTKMKKCYLGFLEIRFKTLKLQYPFLLLARSFLASKLKSGTEVC